MARALAKILGATARNHPSPERQRAGTDDNRTRVIADMSSGHVLIHSDEDAIQSGNYLPKLDRL